MKTYSHVRRQRKALDAAAAVLEPVRAVVEAEADEASDASPKEVTSQFTSQSVVTEEQLPDLMKEFGSSGRIRTYNPPVNSRKRPICRVLRAIAASRRIANQTR